MCTSMYYTDNCMFVFKHILGCKRFVRSYGTDRSVAATGRCIRWWFCQSGPDWSWSWGRKYSIRRTGKRVYSYRTQSWRQRNRPSSQRSWARLSPRTHTWHFVNGVSQCSIFAVFARYSGFLLYVDKVCWDKFQTNPSIVGSSGEASNSNWSCYANVKLFKPLGMYCF
jgi:hypothetical protein